MWREGEKRFFGPSTRARGPTTCGSSNGPREPRLQGWTGDGSRRRTTRITFAVPRLQANIIAPDTSLPEESRADEVLRSHSGTQEKELLAVPEPRLQFKASGC
jgi:hypothetical protein